MCESLPASGSFAPDSSVHLQQHFLRRQVVPAVCLTGAEDDLALKWWLRLGKKRVQQVDGVIQKILVGFARSDMQFATKFGAERFPVLLEHQAQVVLPPLFG